jgi:hypothetical protein
LKQSPQQHIIHLEPAYRCDPHHGRSTGHESAIMRHEGEIIGTSRQPLMDAARYLLEAGIARAADRLSTFRGATRCLSAPIGMAAKLAVSEGEHGLKIVRYRAFETATGAKAAA